MIEDEKLEKFEMVVIIFAGSNEEVVYLRWGILNLFIILHTLQLKF